MKNVYMIAGPNGSGKTTFARTFLPEYAKCDRFINADLIAEVQEIIKTSGVDL